ncbi:MAG: sulfite exporter TauE/SafE family protein [Patescibacteria group bacterium]
MTQEKTLNIQKTHTLFVRGMHCRGCEALTESELHEHPNVFSVQSRLENQTVEIIGDFEGMSLAQIAEELSKLLSQHSLSTQEQKKKADWSEFKIAAPWALAFMFVFVLLQKMGVVNLVNVSQINYGAAFLIGLMASVSTCMAVVGGLVLSMSATFASTSLKLRGVNKTKPIIFFHIGRIISFFILGGAIGTLGSSFTLNTGATFVLSVVIGLVMLIMGINLLDVFHLTKKLEPSMPKFIGKHIHGISKFNHSFTPFLVGVATFFLPCGFTQAMQIFTLTTHSFVKGGLTMLAFALGTLPVLALISFGSLGLHNSSKKSVFFKTAGLVVILFALFNLINSLVVIGFIPPVFNF